MCFVAGVERSFGSSCELPQFPLCADSLVKSWTLVVIVKKIYKGKDSVFTVSSTSRV